MKNSGKLGLVPASYKGLQHREERRYFDERRPVREEEKIFRFNVKYFIYLTDEKKLIVADLLKNVFVL